MVIYNSGKFNYWYTENQSALIFQKKSEVQRISSDIQKIATNTVNTFEKERELGDLLNNTVQGKIAEDMFIDFIDFHQEGHEIKYLPYDSFRKDDFETHAPMDGLIYKDGNKAIDLCIEKIALDVKESNRGSIKVDTRKLLKDNNVYTVEIKSSKIPDKVYENIDIEGFKKREIQKYLLNELRKYDIFTYPAFTRDLGDIIGNFYQYCKYVRSIRVDYQHMSEEVLKKEILNYEAERKSDINIRIFIDFKNTESLIGYITAYALGSDFIENPKIINMYSEKSGKALYFAFPISKCQPLLYIFEDRRLWGN